jgi:hypothetical protein
MGQIAKRSAARSPRGRPLWTLRTLDCGCRGIAVFNFVLFPGMHEQALSTETDKVIETGAQKRKTLRKHTWYGCQPIAKLGNLGK